MQRRSFLAAPLVIAAPPSTPPLAEKITAFGFEWDVISAADWKGSKDEKSEILSLVTARPQQANPRRPIQFALARTEPLARFTLDVDVKRISPKGSLIVVYAWQRDGYFNYLHVSDDAASKVEVHNGVFHCYGGDRVRISPAEGPGTLPTDGWHTVRMSYDAAKGLLEASVDGRSSPSMRAIDLSLGAGRIGLGSFFNTGDFRNFKLNR